MSNREPYPAELFANRSTPGLSRQLTTKISNTLFHNDTVIHRPKLSSRPSVQTTYFTESPERQQAGSSPEIAMSEVPSLPSLPSQTQSAPGSSNPPLSQSTAPTSVVSSNAPLSAETTHRANNETGNVQTNDSPTYETAGECQTSRWLVFPRQDAPRLTQPSVATV